MSEENMHPDAITIRYTSSKFAAPEGIVQNIVFQHVFIYVISFGKRVPMHLSYIYTDDECKKRLVKPKPITEPRPCLPLKR